MSPGPGRNKGLSILPRGNTAPLGAAPPSWASWWAGEPGNVRHQPLRGRRRRTRRRRGGGGGAAVTVQGRPSERSPNSTPSMLDDKIRNFIAVLSHFGCLLVPVNGPGVTSFPQIATNICTAISSSFLLVKFHTSPAISLSPPYC